MRMPLFAFLLAFLCLHAAPGLALAQDVPAPDPAPQSETVATKDPVFTQEQLDQMLAPVALYPDALLAQVLMAATYPGQVSEAVTWSKANPKASGDDAVKQVAKQPWDPSVQALVAFPQLLATLGQDPVWVQRLGDAFLAQPDDVMSAVQRLRHQAQAAGNLQSNQYQNVTVQAAPATPAASSPPSTIIIQPADPQVVYVPSYNPTTVYGTWAYPASPPVYYPPPPSARPSVATTYSVPRRATRPGLRWTGPVSNRPPPAIARRVSKCARRRPATQWVTVCNRVPTTRGSPSAGRNPAQPKGGKWPRIDPPIPPAGHVTMRLTAYARLHVPTCRLTVVAPASPSLSAPTPHVPPDTRFPDPVRPCVAAEVAVDEPSSICGVAVHCEPGLVLPGGCSRNLSNAGEGCGVLRYGTGRGKTG